MCANPNIHPLLPQRCAYSSRHRVIRNKKNAEGLTAGEEEEGPKQGENAKIPNPKANQLTWENSPLLYRLLSMSLKFNWRSGWVGAGGGKFVNNFLPLSSHQVCCVVVSGRLVRKQFDNTRQHKTEEIVKGSPSFVFIATATFGLFGVSTFLLCCFVCLMRFCGTLGWPHVCRG